MGETNTPQNPHQPISLDVVAKYVNLGRAIIAKYPVLSIAGTSVVTYYAPLLKPYVAALGRLVGLTCQ